MFSCLIISYSIHHIIHHSWDIFHDEYEYISSEDAKEMGIYYEEENKEITITDYKGTNKTLVIPKCIDGVDVKYINGLKFLGIEHLVILASLKEIKTSSITNCYSLKKVTVYGSLGLVGQGVFASSKIPEITWQGVTYLTINNNYAYLAKCYTLICHLLDYVRVLFFVFFLNYNQAMF